MPIPLRDYWESRFQTYCQNCGYVKPVTLKILERLAAVPDEELPAVEAGPNFMYILAGQVYDEWRATTLSARNEAIKAAYTVGNARQAVSAAMLKHHDVRRQEKLKELQEHFKGEYPVYMVNEYIFRWCYSRKVPAHVRRAMVAVARLELTAPDSQYQLTSAYAADLHQRVLEVLRQNPPRAK